ncbi:glycerophosphodiester phosphodiesterase [Boudabousia liubingyangii]|uniref:ABC-F family ATP-binding cassette domain-containing protein n=1 Tax=Boudabousia liubingyangii TaxID=1921764 RepID=UPI0009405FD6|nr:ABC-F family ATP-binding cassette domain-containing protein [Boudabousia liubingyangii]OKL46333.1 glycerophosphodiester phosphodiesterase [Boudabousia liubingyangii]
MAHLIGLQDVRALAGPRILLDEVNLGFDDGARVGVLGPNGAGKSTLLRLIAGTQAPDAGLVTRAEGTRIAMLQQADQMDPQATVLETVHPGKEAFEWASKRANREVHEGLLADLDLNQRLGELSGGQKRRVALAAQLCIEAEVLLLDEPTNHLDVEGVNWLAQHLKNRYQGASKGTGALIVVTHDRWFLDEICTRVLEVVPGVDPGGGRPQIPGRIEQYEGSYAAYILARAERARQAQVNAAKRENLLRKELAWLRRGAPARTSKPRFRIEAAETLINDVPPPRDQVELMRMASARLGKDVLDLENVTLSYQAPDGTENTILKDVTWRLAPAERVGIVGVNGAGKTTLLRLLEGVLEPTAGRIKRGKTVSVAVLSQSTHELDDLLELRVVEAVNQVAASVQVGKKELTASQLVERLGFTKERAWTPIAELSGGERRRLQLMRLLMSEPNVLLLDEPTNDLDTDTLAAMEDLLDGFAGTLVVVSHDRYLLERVTDHQVALLGDGQVRFLPGGVEQYLEMREEAKQADSASGAASSATKTAEAEATDSPQGGQDASSAGPTLTSQQRRELVKEVARVEKRLNQTQKQAAALEEKLADIANGRAGDLAQTAREHAQLLAQVEELEMDWLELTTQLDEA